MVPEKTPKDIMKRTARDIMTQPVVTAKEDMLLTDVIRLLLRWHISGMPVLGDDGKPVGFISENHVVNSTLSGSAADTRVREVMTKKVETCAPETLMVEMVNRYAANISKGVNRVRRVLVVEKGKVIGIITRRDILREMNRIYSQF
jgi:CBS domain-containing protein